MLTSTELQSRDVGFLGKEEPEGWPEQLSKAVQLCSHPTALVVVPQVSDRPSHAPKTNGEQPTRPPLERNCI